jgi:hypothetical protein
MATRLPTAPLDVTVTIDGQRWRRLPDEQALQSAPDNARVFVVDRVTGTVRFGDGRHGARPPSGARVRVRYRQAAGRGGDLVVSWEGRWPPPASAFANALAPVSGGRRRRRRSPADDFKNETC